MAWKGTDVKVITLIYIGAIQNVHNIPMHTIVDGRNMKIVHMVAINGIVTQSEVSVRGPTKAQKLWCRSEVGDFLLGLGLLPSNHMCITGNHHSRLRWEIVVIMGLNTFPPSLTSHNNYPHYE